MRSWLATSLLLFVLVPIALFGQTPPSSRKAKEAFDKAQKAWQDRQIPQAVLNYEKVLEIEPDHYDSNLKLAQISDLQKSPALAKKYYQKLISLKPADPQSAGAYQWIGNSLFQKEAYDSAAFYFEKALTLFPEKSSQHKLADKSLKSAKFAAEAIKTPLPVKKRSLGDTVNSLISQYFPVLTADNESLIFSGLTPEKDENIYITNKKDGYWDVPEQISKSINSANNEGTCSISADGRTLVFTACNREDGHGSCDLYITQKQGSDWSIPKNMGDVINSRQWESQPSLSADGRILYFSSDRKGSIGKTDIWYSRMNNVGEWSQPINAGNLINTEYEEFAPFIHANGRVLFYSSNGLPGMGGYDLFLSQLTDTIWTKPVNLGYPLNTVRDQVGLFIASDGKEAYYTDENPASGKPTLYTFELPGKIKEMVIPTRYAKGKVLDKKTGKPVSAHIDLFDLQSQQKVGEYKSDEKTGAFLAVINHGSSYAFYVSEEGYLFKSLSFSVNDSVSVLNMEIPLESLEKDHSEILSNIFFKTGSYELDDKSKVELDRLAAFLNENKKIRIEISGHTDDIGTDKANQELSNQRAISVVEYLKSSGISSERLTAKGYGKTRPIAPNNSEENRQKNRRIQWSVL